MGVRIKHFESDKPNIWQCRVVLALSIPVCAVVTAKSARNAIIRADKLYKVKRTVNTRSLSASSEVKHKVT
jgi:hypothetical protein